MSARTDRSRLRDAAGFAAVVLACGLAWPGVQARADESALMSVDPALEQAVAEPPLAAARPAREPATCSNPGGPTPVDDAMARHQVRQALRAYAKRIQAERGDDPEAGIVLNGSGYNYRPYRERDETR